MLVFDKDLYKEYCKAWEPDYCNNEWSNRWAEESHGNKVYSYTNEKGNDQYYYIFSGDKDQKSFVDLSWCKEVRE